MAERLTLAMFNAQQGHQALQTVWRDCIKPMLIAGHRMTLEAKPETRSSAQNARLHALLTELSKRTEWHGQKLPMETWKRLCTAAWMREERQSPQLVPALDGNGVDIIYERTSKLSKAECGRLMEWVEAFAAEHGINLGEWVDPDSGEVHNG